MSKYAQIKEPLKVSEALMDSGMYGNGHLFIFMKKPLAMDFPAGADHCFFFPSY